MTIENKLNTVMTKTTEEQTRVAENGRFCLGIKSVTKIFLAMAEAGELKGRDILIKG